MHIEVLTADNAASLAEKVFAEGPVQFVSVHGGQSHAPEAFSDFAQQAQALLCATSCQGVMTHAGHTPGLAAFVLRDPDGDYGSAAGDFGSSPRAAAQAVLERALQRADRPGEKPELVWLAVTAGSEEEVLAGLRDVIGDDVPVIGGTAADDDISGQWKVAGPDGTFGSGLAVSVFFPSRPLSFAYQNGYAPTEHTGTVTAADGRNLLQIDGRPAAEVYSEWTNQSVPVASAGVSRQILSESTFWPLGREITSVGNVPYHLLAHPAVSEADGTIGLFAEVAEGEVLTQMNGSPESLIARAGRVASLACSSGQVSPDAVKGALIIYCGGCMLSVQDRLDEVIDGLRGVLTPAPFLGLFTFGEQGQIVGAGNRHGNLMISCIIFS